MSWRDVVLPEESLLSDKAGYQKAVADRNAKPPEDEPGIEDRYQFGSPEIPGPVLELPDGFDDAGPPDEEERDYEEEEPADGAHGRGQIAPETVSGAINRSTHLDVLRSRLVNREQLRDLPRPGYLVDKVLPAGCVALLYGRPGVGKSFLATDWACSIATRCWWLGREVVEGPVLYVVAEGAFGIDPRIAAWEQARNIAEVKGVQWLRGAVNLLDKGWVGGLVDLAGELQPVLTVVDTLARCLVGGDENSAKDVGMAIDAVDRVRQTTMGTVLVVHHASRDGGNARGSSALDGAADTIIEVRASGDTGMKLVCEKQKDDQPFPDIFVERVKVGDSCAIYCQNAVAVDEDLARSETSLLDTVLAVVGSEGMSSAGLLRVAEMPDRTFYRALKALANKGLVVNIGTNKQTRWVSASEVAS